MRARLLRQPEIDSETTKSQSEQEIAASEIQEKKEVEENANPVSTHPFIIDPKSQAEADWENSTEILDPDQAEFHHLDPDPDLIKDEHREEAKADFKSQLQPQINPEDELKCNKQKFTPNADPDSTSNLAMNSTTTQPFNFTRSFHQSTRADNEIDMEDKKLEENLDLQLDHSDLEANLAATENAIIGVEVNAIAKEEGEDTANDDGLSWVQSHNKDNSNSWVHRNDEVVVSVERKVEAICIAPKEVEGATRLPPEPPDPNSVMVVTAEAKSRRDEGRTEVVPAASHSGAVDDFVAEGNRRTLVALVEGDATVRARLLRDSAASLGGCASMESPQ
ncbi:hypothetical protein PIB30_006501 [Stylosanthes scabra]|uniref:Uncharacterized protein n=1 Tax=Stylosanthes scabra TaxID=79078 RepID=A0ABU6V7F7_9FABA|nr:hypothetical protein [Stylosanthes scabra]